MTRGRFPDSVYGRGTEPDARFSLANERTFLAWVSVGLALVSVGVGLQSFAANVQPALRLAASALLVVGGTACPIRAWFGWAQVETAMRERRPLPSSGMVPLLPVLLGIVGVLILLGLLIR
jgi:putative membrane protein